MTTPQYPSSPGGQGPAPYQQPGYRSPGHQPDPAYSGTSAQPGHTSPYQAGAYPAASPYAGSGELTHGGMPPQRRPVTVWVAAIVIWLGCLVLLAAGVAALVLRASVDFSPDPQAPPSIFDGLDIVVSGMLVAIGAGAIASAVVLAALTYGAFRGNNACRWTLIILHGLSLLPLVPAVVAMIWQPGQAPGQWWLPVLAPAVILVVLIVLWAVPPASHWYRYRGDVQAR